MHVWLLKWNTNNTRGREAGSVWYLEEEQQHSDRIIVRTTLSLSLVEIRYKVQIYYR